MKNIKKIIAGVSVLALVAMNALTTNWAWLSGATATYDDPTDAINVVVAWKNFTTDGISVWSVKTSAGVSVDSWDTTEVTEANGSFEIISSSFNALAADNYSVSFTTANWDYWAAVVYIWDANVVNVSATVLPLLSMDLSSNSISFGELVPWVANNKTVNVITESNAKDGITVSVAATWLATWWTASDKYIWNLARASATATSASDSYQIASSTTAWGTVITTTNVASTQNVLTTAGVAASNATTTVTLSATATAQTEAWNYNDTLTFTVTGTF